MDDQALLPPETARLWQPDPGWLNTASYGLPPTRAWDAMQAALTDWRHGRTSWEGWGEATSHARARFAELVGVPVADVSVGSVVSQMLAPVAAAIPDGARVLVPDIEFTSNLFPYAVHAHRDVEVVTVPVAQLAERVDDRTDVVAYSLVQSATGEVADHDRIHAAARAAGAMVVVDATQAAGWLPFDAASTDVCVVGGYKWLMNPRGTGFCYVAPELRERVVPLAAGWYAGADVHDSYYGPPLRLASDARRLDVSPAWHAWVGAAPAMDVIAEIGVEAIHAHDVALANHFRKGLGLEAGDSAIVSVAVPDADRRLAAAGIRASSRAGQARLAFHAYTTTADVDLAIEALT